MFGGGQADDMFSTSTFELLDTDLKYVAHTESLTAQVRFMFIEWGDLFILTLDGKVRSVLLIVEACLISSSSFGIMRNLYNRS